MEKRVAVVGVAWKNGVFKDFDALACTLALPAPVFSAGSLFSRGCGGVL